MKLNFITFMVRDLEKSITFYQELAGLQVVRRLSPAAGEIAFLANEKGESMLEFIAFEGTEKVSTRGMAINFSADVELTKLREKAISLGYNPSEIFTGGPKPKYLKVADPDGIIVEFGV